MPKIRVQMPWWVRKVVPHPMKDPIVRQKFSRTKRKLYAEGKISPWNKNLTKENDPRVKVVSDKLKVVASREEWKERTRKMGLSNKGRKIPKLVGEQNPAKRPEVRKKISQSLRGWIERRREQGLLVGRKKGFKHSEEWKRKVGEKCSRKLMGRVRTLEHCMHLSQAKREMIKKNPSVVKELIKQLSSASRHPNKSEIRLMDILNKYFPNSWRYVGNGEMEIGGKIPDYMNVDGRRLIELFGEHWHEPEDAEERIKHFSRHGFKTLVIWCKELKEENRIVEKIRDFNSCGEHQSEPNIGEADHQIHPQPVDVVL